MLDGNKEIVVNGVNYTREVFDNLAESHAIELARAENEQIALMQAWQRQSGGQCKNYIFGELRFKLCPEVYNFWKDKLHENIWHDEGFKKWIGKRHGDLLKINSISDKVHLLIS
jgi:hypothetical protein